MSRRLLGLLTIVPLLVSGAAADQAAGSSNRECATIGGSAAETDGSARNGHVATGNRAAVYALSGETSNSDADALELTVRPLPDTSDGQFLVQVFAHPPCAPPQDRTAAENLLGSFSFFPLRAGEIETFVLPKPNQHSSGDLELTIKLVSANPARTLTKAAVEVLGARFVK